MNMVTISMMSLKVVTPGLLKIKMFLNTVYDAIISGHELTNKVLLRDSKYIVDVVL